MRPWADVGIGPYMVCPGAPQDMRTVRDAGPYTPVGRNDHIPPH